MNSWFAMRIPAAGGDKCQVVTLRLGAMSKLGGISIWSVPASHSNGISAAFAQTAAGVPYDARWMRAIITMATAVAA